MLNELKSKIMERINKKSSKNEKVRVRDVKILEEIMKRCRKESSMMGGGIWKIENGGKEWEILKSLNLEVERKEEKGGLTNRDIKN